jgi:hypothetical protein
MRCRLATTRAAAGTNSTVPGDSKASTPTAAGWKANNWKQLVLDRREERRKVTISRGSKTMRQINMVSRLHHPTFCRWFGRLSFGSVFLLLGGPLAQADDFVYVSNTGAGTITRIDPGGNTSPFASGLLGPEGLAFDGAGNLFVANSGSGTIANINSLGTVSTFVSGLNGPAALTFDPGGNLYAASPGDQRS